MSPPNSDFIGGPESVKILGMRDILAVKDKIKPNGDVRTYVRKDGRSRSGKPKQGRPLLGLAMNVTSDFHS